MKIKMPEELGGRIYTVMDYIPYFLWNKIQKATMDNDIDKMKYIILTEVVQDPKIDDEYLKTANGLELDLLIERIMTELRLNEERITELKKKVVRLSD